MTAFRSEMRLNLRLECNECSTKSLERTRAGDLSWRCGCAGPPASLSSDVSAAPVPLTYERKPKDQHTDSGSRCTRRQLLDRTYSRQRRPDSPGHDRLNSLAHHPDLDAHEAYIRFVLQARQCATVERRVTASNSAVSECASAEAGRSTTRDSL